MDESFQYLGGRTEKGDRAVGSTLVFGLGRFWEGNDDRLFPDWGDIRVPVGEVEELAEVLQAEGTEVTKVKDGEVVRAGSCGVVAIFDGVLDLSGGEGIGAVVEWMLPADLLEGASHLSAGAVGNWSGELVTELRGDGLGFGVHLVVEVDGLVWVLVGAFP